MPLEGAHTYIAHIREYPAGNFTQLEVNFSNRHYIFLQMQSRDKRDEPAGKPQIIDHDAGRTSIFFFSYRRSFTL